MKIFIVGAGAVSSVISGLLSKDKNIKHIICGTNDIKRAAHFIQKNKKIKIVKVDASNPNSVTRAARGCDLIINASLPNFNEAIMKAALKIRANYQDLCSHLKDLKNPEQIKYNKKFEKAKLKAMINTGVAPGVTNLLAREIADKLDRLDDINIRLIEDMKSSEFVFSWSPEVTLDEITAKPLNLKNRRFVFVKAFEDLEKYEFPQPFGERFVFNLYGDEVSTLACFLKVKNITYKSGGTDVDFARALFKMGMFGKKPVNVNGTKVVPVKFFSKMAPKIPSPQKLIKMMEKGIVDNAVFVSVVEGIGIESGKKIKVKNTVVYPDLRQISKIFKGATYISYPTGLAAYAFAKTLPDIKKYGVFPPEALDSHIRKKVLIELESKGIMVDEQYSRV
jgi:saccharopine dehydrogenase (NAD+, L-lysine-forming)